MQFWDIVEAMVIGNILFWMLIALVLFIYCKVQQHIIENIQKTLEGKVFIDFGKGQ